MSQDGPRIRTQRPRVFLSSTFKETVDGVLADLALRRRILADLAHLPVEIWAYDVIWAEDPEVPEPATDMIVDRCFEGIRECDLFVFLLSGKHGTGIGYLPEGAQASYLELELFAAAMLRKPILVLHQRGRVPEPALNDVLGLLRWQFSEDQYVVGSDNELRDRFVSECHRLASGIPLPIHPTMRVADWLSRCRSRRTLRAELGGPALRFLDGKLYAHRAGDPAKAVLLLDQVASGRRGDASTQPLPHGAALFRLWTAMRELMADDEHAIDDPFRASLWDRAFGLWASHASWFGLHGHLWMGPLASIQSQTNLRQRFATDHAFRAAGNVREPTGARASALYSIAQRMVSWSGRVRHFRLAEHLAAQAVDADPENCQGALSIRGRAALQLAQLGFFWKVWEAERIFRRSLAMSERLTPPGDAIPQAMLDLGLCLALTGRGATGIQLMQEAISIMRADASPNGQAFLARALRNLERGARFARRTHVADAARIERMTLAMNIQAMDQTR